MDITGTSLYGAYPASPFSGTQPQPGLAPRSIATGPVDSTDSAGTESDPDRSGSASSDRDSEASGPERTSTRFPRKDPAGGDTDTPSTELSPEDLRTVQELKQRDREVRAHEAAHLAAAGRYATSGASFEYARGPDGRNYAVGGEVGIDTSPVPNDPQATIRKAQQIQAAAQAPANPSSTDRQVAASAAQMESKARQELSEQGLTQGDRGSRVSEPPGSRKTDKENSEPGNPRIDTAAASAYAAVADIARSQDDAISAVDLVA